MGKLLQRFPINCNGVKVVGEPHMMKNKIGLKAGVVIGMIMVAMAVVPAASAHVSAPFSFSAGTLNCYIGSGWHKLSAGAAFSTTLTITSGTWRGGFCTVGLDANGNCPGSGSITASLGPSSSVSATWSTNVPSTACYVPASYAETTGTMSQTSSP